MYPRKVAVIACTLALGVTLSSCAGPTGKTRTITHDSGAAQQLTKDQAPAAVGEAHETEVGSDWDEKTDEEILPAHELSASQRTELLRITATSAPRQSSCEPQQVTAHANPNIDAALGSRYGQLTITNHSSQDCVLTGYAGLGARGQWGHQFMVEVEQIPYDTGFNYDDEALLTQPVVLAPEDSAVVPLVWGGSLGGAESEPLDALYLQLHQGGEPILVEDVAEPMSDISMFTSIRLGPFQSVNSVG